MAERSISGSCFYPGAGNITYMAASVQRLHYSTGIDSVVCAALEAPAFSAPGTTNRNSTSLTSSFLNENAKV